MHSKDKLAQALQQAGLQDMAIKAAHGYYHDFLSPLTLPSEQLAKDLIAAQTPAAMDLLNRHMKGEFDSSKAEADDWARTPEGQAMIRGHTIGDAPVEERYRERMQAIATALDELFNGDKKGPDRETGFVLLVFPFGEKSGRCNYISNGADRKDIVVMLKEQIARFEGQAEVQGTA